MGKYYYVNLANKTEGIDTNTGISYFTELGQKKSNIFGEYSLGEYKPNVAAFTVGTTKNGYPINIPIICEKRDDNDNFVIECVTGRQYNLKPIGQRYVDSSKIVFETVQEIPIATVAGIYRKVADFAMRNYRPKLDELERIVAHSYAVDQQEHKKIDQKRAADEAFIRSLRNKFGK
jgi:hypothetical protein